MRRNVELDCEFIRNHQRLSNDHLISASVNVAGDVVVTRIEWITRARNDAALSRSPLGSDR